MQVLEPLDPRLVTALSRRSSYPTDPSELDSIEQIQTHISHVFLTHDRVYKLRKAVAFDFLDFGTRAARRLDCLEEVRLNRRLTANVYLGVAEVHCDEDGVHVGAPVDPDGYRVAGQASETVTVMRRLPEGRDALSLLGRGELDVPRIEDVARKIAVFHAGHRLPHDDASDEWQSAVAGPVWAALASLKGSLSGADDELHRSLEWRTREFECLHGYRFARRLRAGRRVEGHGDLHLQHLWFDDDGSCQIIDCLEFNRALREVDAACDVAFLTMDLRYRGQGHLAERLLAVYAALADDYDLFGVLRYFESYRAVVRAKVANLAARDNAIGHAQRAAAATSRSRHLELAERLFREPLPGDLIVTSGWVGTGKSTVAQRLAESVGGIRIASDLVRKKIAGVSPSQSLGNAWNQGSYSPQKRRAVYAALRARASEVLRSGRSVVLDATFSSREDRDALRHWAREQGLNPWLVEVVCPDAVVEERLRVRKLAATDPSDAGPELLAESKLAYQPPTEWPEARCVCVDTEGSGWRAQVDELSKRVAAARFG